MWSLRIVVIATNIERGIDMEDLISEKTFKLDWPKAKTLGCTNKERVKLEKLIRHIIVDHREMFVEKYKMWSDLFELKIAAIFAESDDGFVNIEPFTIAALAEAGHHAKGHSSIIKPFALEAICTLRVCATDLKTECGLNGVRLKVRALRLISFA